MIYLYVWKVFLTIDHNRRCVIWGRIWFSWIPFLTILHFISQFRKIVIKLLYLRHSLYTLYVRQYCERPIFIKGTIRWTYGSRIAYTLIWSNFIHRYILYYIVLTSKRNTAVGKKLMNFNILSSQSCDNVMNDMRMIFGNNSFIMIFDDVQITNCQFKLKNVRVKVTIFVFVCRI